MEILKLETEIRTDSGKGQSRKLRSGGKIPAVLYGRKEDPMSLAVDEAAMRTILHQHPESAVIDLFVKDGGSDEPVNVIVRDVQRNPTTGKLLHVDFQRIKFGEKIRVEVKIVLTGTPRGVKEQGGILDHGTRSTQVMCLPRKIPESIELDVSDLMIGDGLKLQDLFDKYPDLDFMDDGDTSLANVLPPIVEAKPAAEGEEAAEGEPDLVAKEKEGEEPAGDAAKDAESS